MDEVRVVKRHLWALIVSYVTALLIGLGCILYTNHAVSENNSKWCEILSPLDEAYRSAPLQSDVGKRVAFAIHQRHVDFNC